MQYCPAGALLLVMLQKFPLPPIHFSVGLVTLKPPGPDATKWPVKVVWKAHA